MVSDDFNHRLGGEQLLNYPVRVFAATLFCQNSKVVAYRVQRQQSRHGYDEMAHTSSRRGPPPQSNGRPRRDRLGSSRERRDGEAERRTIGSQLDREA